jgi:HAMP domain-containing protein
MTPKAEVTPAKGGYTLWLWVAAGFVFIAILWTAMFTAARQADTRTVPLATQGGRP